MYSRSQGKCSTSPNAGEVAMPCTCPATCRTSIPQCRERVKTAKISQQQEKSNTREDCIVDTGSRFARCLRHWLSILYFSVNSASKG